MADQLLSSLDFVDMVMYAWTDGNHAFVRLKAYTTHITSVPFPIFPLFDLVIFGHIWPCLIC
jgi:hypothetical protein